MLSVFVVAVHSLHYNELEVVGESLFADHSLIATSGGPAQEEE